LPNDVKTLVQFIAQRELITSAYSARVNQCSKRNDFETSTPQTNAAVATVISTPGVFGARMRGDGFGGCIVILPDANSKI